MLQCVNSSGVPTMPDAVPVIKVWSGSTLIVNKEMPLLDKAIQIGLFRYSLFAGELFAIGSYTIELFYVRGGVGVVEERRFDLIAGGNTAGQVISMLYYHRPQADYIVYQTEDGRIRRGKNPRVQ